jgi:hypothetical protein
LGGPTSATAGGVVSTVHDAVVPALVFEPAAARTLKVCFPSASGPWYVTEPAGQASYAALSSWHWKVTPGWESV